MNDMRLQQQQQLNGQRNSNFSTATIVKKRNNNNNTGGSFSLAKNEIDINNEEEPNVNSNEFSTNNYHHNSDDIFQQSAYESQYPEDMIDVQVIAKMQEESEFKLKFQNVKVHQNIIEFKGSLTYTYLSSIIKFSAKIFIKKNPAEFPQSPARNTRKK